MVPGTEATPPRKTNSNDEEAHLMSLGFDCTMQRRGMNEKQRQVWDFRYSELIGKTLTAFARVICFFVLTSILFTVNNLSMRKHMVIVACQPYTEIIRDWADGWNHREEVSIIVLLS